MVNNFYLNALWHCAHVGQKLLTLPKHMRSQLVFSGVRFSVFSVMFGEHCLKKQGAVENLHNKIFLLCGRPFDDSLQMMNAPLIMTAAIHRPSRGYHPHGNHYFCCLTISSLANRPHSNQYFCCWTISSVGYHPHSNYYF
jgi:hypothetical protein